MAHLSKKYGSDLYLCPKELIPSKPISSSDQIFSELNKKTIEHPFEQIHIDGYSPSKPWCAPAAVAQLENTDTSQAPLAFPTVEELDNEIDFWPESNNPFTDTTPVFESDTNVGPDQVSTLNTTAIQHPPLSSLLPALIRSISKLFFISFKLDNQDRREWKLMQVDLDKSMKLRPSCLQDGSFLCYFYLLHTFDDSADLTEKRYWLQYHEILDSKHLSTEYHMVQPTEFSRELAHKRNLVPYHMWISIFDPDTFIHGPFDFAMRNGRQTRDRISNVDWDILISNKSKYDNDPPASTITASQKSYYSQLSWNEHYINTAQDDTVSDAISSFHNSIDISETQDLASLGFTLED